MESVQPLAFSNLDQDKKGFIYTTTLGTDDNQIKRLSPVGIDTLNHGVKKYGDLFSYGNNITMTSFIDLSVNDDGLITALNLQSSRVYQYDKLGNLLFVFGGTGEQDGVFTTPSSIAQNSDGILFITDKGRTDSDIIPTDSFR